VPDARTARTNTLLSFNTIRAASAIDEAIQDAERGQRGFLITGREVYLDPYMTAKERLPQLMVDLQQATITTSCFDGRFVSDGWSGSGKASIADHS
jgi:CHASE3 domain sensor protein